MTLEPTDVDIALAELEGWTNDGDALTKTYTFDDFAAAMDFMQRAAGPIDGPTITRSGPMSTTGSTSG